jgi:ADP-ribosyl-[dinitrogen reductase] hydrolase
MTDSPDLPDRYLGCLLGLACGDAVGTTVEFSPRGSFEPVTDMVGGGPFGLKPGQWTDDTSMALCLATSLVHCNGFDPVDQMNRYVNWWQWGYLSATGECFDIGMTVAKALQRYLVTQDPYAGSADPATAGNGSLMRLAPVALRYASFDRPALLAHARLSSATTHAAPEALECCEVFAELIANALQGLDKASALACRSAQPATPKVKALAAGAWRDRTHAEIAGTGYCVASLEAALWCVHHGTGFEDTVLMAANLGDDADTTAAIAGQLAGALYGKSGIPARWLERLHMRDEIERLGTLLWQHAAGSAHHTGAP